MPSFVNKIVSNKKIILLLLIVITLPFLMDLVSLIAEIIFKAGTVVGTLIRKAFEVNVC